MKFRVLIEGQNYLVALDKPSPRKHGFYVTAHVEAPTEEVAEALAFDLLRAKHPIRKLSQNNAEDQPRLRVEKITHIADFPSDAIQPLSGLAWYEEEKA